MSIGAVSAEPMVPHFAVAERVTSQEPPPGGLNSRSIFFVIEAVVVPLPQAIGEFANFAPLVS